MKFTLIKKNKLTVKQSNNYIFILEREESSCLVMILKLEDGGSLGSKILKFKAADMYKVDYTLANKLHEISLGFFSKDYFYVTNSLLKFDIKFSIPSLDYTKIQDRYITHYIYDDGTKMIRSRENNMTQFVTSQGKIVFNKLLGAKNPNIISKNFSKGCLIYNVFEDKNQNFLNYWKVDEGLVWKKNLKQQVSQNLISEGKLIFNIANPELQQGADRLYCIEIETGEVIWESKLPTTYLCACPKKKIIVAKSGRSLIKFSIDTGEVLYTLEIDESAGGYKVPKFIEGDFLYYTYLKSKDKGRIGKIDLNTFEVVWEYQRTNDINNILYIDFWTILGNGHHLIYNSHYDGPYLFSFDPDSEENIPLRLISNGLPMKDSNNIN